MQSGLAMLGTTQKTLRLFSLLLGRSADRHSDARTRSAQYLGDHGRRSGILGSWLLRFGDQHAESRSTGCRRSPIHSILQRLALLPDSSRIVDRQVPTRSRFTQQRRIALEGRSDACRDLSRQRLPHGDDWQVAPDPCGEVSGRERGFA